MKQLVKHDERTVAFRALCMGAIIKRGEIEKMIDQSHDILLFDDMRQRYQQQQEKYYLRLMRWIEAEGIAFYFTETELSAINQAVGTWTPEEVRRSQMRIEALGTLLWALNRIEYLPAYDEAFSIDEVLEPLDIYTSTIDFIWLARLQTCDQLVRRRDEAEMWNWRSRARELERLGLRPPVGVSFREIVRFTTERAYQNGLITTPCDGDFPAFGKPYVHTNEKEYETLSVIASQRYSVFNWLCDLSDGGASRYF